MRTLFVFFPLLFATPAFADDAASSIPAEKLSSKDLARVLMARESEARRSESNEIAIPITAIGISPLLVLIGVLYSLRRQSVTHTTMRLMVEKGAEIPAELLIGKKRSDLRTGLLLLAVGSSSIVSLALLTRELGVISLGLVPMSLGFAYIALSKLDRG